MRKGLPPRDIEREMYNRQSFLDFLKGLLNLNPLERWSPLQAIQHPFITGEPFTGPYIPSEKTRNQHQSANKRSSDMGPKKSVVSMFQSRRPRANTISSSKVQNVPPQLKSLVAAQQLQGSNRFPHPEAAERMRDLPQADESRMPDYVSNPGTNVIHSQVMPSDTNCLVRRKSQIQNQSYPVGPSSSFPDSSSPKVDHLVYSNSQVHIDHSIHVYHDSGNNSTNTSYERFPSEILPTHGSTGERSNIPSRIPSSANSVEWEMYDNLDAQGSIYNVSATSSMFSGPSSMASSRQGSMMDMSSDYISQNNGGDQDVSQGHLNMAFSHSFSGVSPFNSGESSRGIERKYSQGTLSVPSHIPGSNSNASSESYRRKSFSHKYGGKTSDSLQQPLAPPFDAKRHSVNPELFTSAYQQRRQYDYNPKRRPRRATHYDNPNQNSGIFVGPTNNHNVASMPESVNVRPPLAERRRFSDMSNPHSSFRENNDQSQNYQSFSNNGSSAGHPSFDHEHDN